MAGDPENRLRKRDFPKNLSSRSARPALDRPEGLRPRTEPRLGEPARRCARNPGPMVKRRHELSRARPPYNRTRTTARADGFTSSLLIAVGPHPLPRRCAFATEWV